MGPREARRLTNKWLSRYGQPVVLQRLSSPSLAVTAQVTIQAHISDFKVEDLGMAQGLQIGDSRLIMSASEVWNNNWPTANDSHIPRKGDRVVYAGRTRTVLYAWPAPYVNNELVRIELAIR